MTSVKSAYVASSRFDLRGTLLPIPAPTNDYAHRADGQEGHGGRLGDGTVCGEALLYHHRSDGRRVVAGELAVSIDTEFVAGLRKVKVALAIIPFRRPATNTVIKGEYLAFEIHASSQVRPHLLPIDGLLIFLVPADPHVL